MPASVCLPFLLSLSVASSVIEDRTPVEVEAHEPALTLRLSPFLAFPDVLSASLTIHAIPYFDVEAGAGYGVFISTAYVRGGPRLLLFDWRNSYSKGWMMRASLLGGYKIWKMWETPPARGINAMAALDCTYWATRKVGITVQFAGGALVSLNPGDSVMSDTRFSVGVTF